MTGDHPKHEGGEDARQDVSALCSAERLGSWESARARLVSPAQASLPRSWPTRAAYPQRRSSNANSLQARIRLDSRKSVRSFKGIICVDISEFESYMPSHAVGLSASPLVSVGGAFRLASRYAGSILKGEKAATCQSSRP